MFVRFLVCAVGFNELAEKTDDHFRRRNKVWKITKRSLLHKPMLSVNRIFKNFVTGAKYGQSKYFYCHLSFRDVAIGTHGSSKIVCHFGSKGDWLRDVV